jgi:hypothetical protein
MNISRIQIEYRIKYDVSSWLKRFHAVRDQPHGFKFERPWIYES